MRRPPLLLIVSEHEWASRSLDAVLAPQGYAVLRAYNGRQALERTRAANPDAVLVDGNLSDTDAAGLITQLRTEGGLSPAAAVIAIFAGTLSREDRLRLLRSGAWDVLSLPLDADELLLRVQRFIDGKMESDRVREQALLDPGTGLYTWEGIVRRVQELGAAAARFSRPLACIVLTTVDEASDVQSVAQLLQEVTRRSDVIGRTGSGEFIVVAPDTAPDGARTLAERMHNAAAAGLSGAGCRIGVFGVPDLREAGLDPMEVIVRATMAAGVRSVEVDV